MRGRRQKCGADRAGIARGGAPVAGGRPRGLELGGAAIEVADASQLALWAAYENGKLLQHPSIRLHASFYVSAQTVQWQNHFLGVGASGGEAYSQLDRAGVVESTLWHGMEVVGCSL